MPALDRSRIDAIGSLVTEWLDENEVPGASLVIVDETDELYAEGFGARDLETNAPATPETVYGMGSISKAVTALAVGQLAEADRLAFEDSVAEYVDHYASAPGAPITIGELLSHTSGMPATPTGLFAQSMAGYPAGIADETDRNRFVKDSAGYRVTDRERFMYYNTGYDVLGEVVETVADQPYAEYVREEIFEPLGMAGAGFDRSVLETAEDAMTPYRPGEDDAPPEPAAFPVDALSSPSGGLLCSVRELSRFLRAMMTDGRFDGGSVCASETVDRLQEGRAVRHTFLDGTDQEYGYGWIRQPFDADEVVGHGGSVLVSTAYAGFLKDGTVGIALACNTSADPHPGELGAAILSLATGGEPTAVPAYALKEKCDAVLGRYEAFNDAYAARVERADGGLSITFEREIADETVHAVPETLDPQDYRFYTVSGAGARLPIEFDLAGDKADLYFRRSRLKREGPANG